MGSLDVFSTPIGAMNLSADEANRRNNLASRTLLLPLPEGPEGEGWGEGENS